MSSICTFVSMALYNRFSQSPAIQKLAAGVGCLSQGKRLLCDPDPSPAPSLIRKIGRKAAGLALLAGGLAGLYYGGKPLVTASTDDLKAAFLFGQNSAPSIQEDRYEQVFKKQTEVLYLGASPDADYNGALDPSTSYSLPTCLDAISKLKYKTIHHPLQICEEIQSASETGSVQDLVIGAHGSIRTMALSPTSIFKVFDPLPANCFDGLAPTARIFLQSCSTGAHSLWRPNVAEWMSWISGKEVIAASAVIFSSSGQCGINPSNGRLDIRLKGPDPAEMAENSVFFFSSGDVDHTTHFNTSASWAETALFSVKMVAPTILGAMTTWQGMRFGATVLQGSGAAAEWLIDKSAAPTKRLSERIGLYNPDAAQILYTTTKRTSQILNATGKAAHQGMDKLLQPVSNLGSWMFGKSITAATNVAQTLYSKIRRD